MSEQKASQDLRSKAILFYGYVQPDEDDTRWNDAAARFEEEIGEQTPDENNPVVLYDLLDGRHYLAVEASLEIADDDAPIQISSEWMHGAPVERWKAMLVDFASRYGIQLWTQEPGWCLGVSE